MSDRKKRQPSILEVVDLIKRSNAGIADEEIRLRGRDISARADRSAPYC